jgi:hypothetical protein
MGTSNFHNVNAYNVYAVMMNYEQEILDEDGNETDETETIAPESWEVEDFIDDIRTQAEALTVGSNFKYYKELEMADPHSLRSYGSTPLFQLYHKKDFGDVGVEININCVARHAYYEGASLDWYVSCTIAGETNLIEDTDYEIDEYISDMNAGLRKIQSRNVEAWAASVKDSLIETVEKLFTENSMPLVVTARFSNGETHYAKVG